MRLRQNLELFESLPRIFPGAAKPQSKWSADFSPLHVSNWKNQGMELAPQWRRALKRNKFRAPKIVAPCDFFTTKMPLMPELWQVDRSHERTRG